MRKQNFSYLIGIIKHKHTDVRVSKAQKVQQKVIKLVISTITNDKTRDNCRAHIRSPGNPAEICFIADACLLLCWKLTQCWYPVKSEADFGGAEMIGSINRCETAFLKILQVPEAPGALNKSKLIENLEFSRLHLSQFLRAKSKDDWRDTCARVLDA